MVRAAILSTLLLSVLSHNVVAQERGETATDSVGSGSASSDAGLGQSPGQTDQLQSNPSQSDQPSRQRAGSAGGSQEVIGGTRSRTPGEDNPTDAEADPDDDGARSTVPEHESDELFDEPSYRASGS